MVTDSEIAALLALPPEARDALKGVSGPGFALVTGVVVADSGQTSERTEVQLWPSAEACHFSMSAWLPCSPVAILKAAGRAASDKALLVARMGPPSHSIGDETGGRWWVALGSYDDTYSLAEYGDTPHLAALALLHSVWEK